MSVAWRIRPATADDGKLLQRFRCVHDRDAWPWEREVERFVRHEVLPWALDPHAAAGDPRLLLVVTGPDDELVALGAHERCTVHDPATSRSLAVTRVQVLAVAEAWQGRRFPSSSGDGPGPRVSDVLMAAVLQDISARAPQGSARVMAVVHQHNVRSLALCRRHGLTEELSRPHPDYRRLVTPSGT